MAMDRPPNLTAGIFLLLLAVYHASAQCKFSCSGASGSVKLEPGKSYHYDLSGTTVTTKPGANGDVSKLSLNAKVEIIAGAHCDHVISLSNVHTSGPDGKKHSLDKTLGNRHTKFGLDGGKLEKLCVDPEESQPSVNIKRAAISLLQVALSKGSGGEVVETDVFGVCPTSIDLSKSGNTLHVVKTRNLNRCALREGLNLPVAAPSYYNPSDIQGYSLLSGELKVNQKIENGVVKSAEAQENYEYNPTASLEAGTKISVTTKLSLSGVSPKPLPPAVKCTTEKTLVFDTEHESEFRGTAAEITSLIKKVTESGVVNAEDARHFTSLVNAVSVAPKAEILSVFHACQSGSVSNDKDSAKKLLLDALYSSLSASSVEVIADLIKSKDIAGEELNFWYMRMGNVKHASRASLTSALPLLGGSPSDAAYLGLGQLGGRFCAEHNCNFFGLNEVNAFQKKLGEPLLKKGCIPKNHKDEDQLIASIKGLGNMKFLTKDVSVKLAACFINKAVKSRIRSAVADTMSTDPHKTAIKEAAIKVFIDPKEDSELRIKAYLVLVKCPCGSVAQHVTDVLESQKSYQVGSFIVSHLKNLKASTNPDKADAQRHLNSVVTSKKYKHDQRKYSQNYELSYSLDVLNMGAASEANVIYSQKSWMPRYLSLNLTSQLYGHAYNLLELGARLDNVEKIVENLVGPKGYLRTHSANDVIDKTKSYANGIWEKIMSRSDKVFRPKRSPTTWSELSALANKVNLGLDSDHDVNIDLSLKSFGAEIGWLKLHEAEGKIKPDKIINDAFGKLDEVINEAKDFDKDYRKNIVFSNVEATYPTSLGLALRLKSLGTGSVRVKVDGKIDVPAILKNPQNADLKLQLIPSAALELRGDLSVDGIAVETGVRVALNVHSSTATTLTFRVLDGHGVDVKVGLPVNKQEIISVKTHINTVVKEDGKPETLSPVSFDTKKETYQGCFDQATFLIGLTFCGKVSTPWDGPRSISPAYGPSELSLEVVKDDESLNTYHLRFYQQINDGKANIEFLFDTPESSADRKISVVFDGELKPKKYLKVNLHTPWLGASVDGSVVDTDNELSANAKLNLDDAEYLIKLGAKKSKNGNELKLEPIFEYKAKGMSYNEALIGRRQGTKSVSTQQTTTVSGVILVNLNENPHSRKWKIQGLSLNTPQMTFVLDGTGKCDDKGVEIDNVLQYGEDSVAIKGHALHEGPKRSLHIGVSPSQNKDASVDILFTTHKTGDIGSKLDYENKLIITHGVDPNAETPRISFINKVNKDAKASSLSLSTKVTYPLVQLDGQASLSITPNTLGIGVQGNFDKYSGGFQINGDVDSKKLGEYNVGLSGNLMKNSISISSSRKILKAHQSKFVNVLDLKPGGHYTLTSTVTHDFNGKNLDLQVDAVAKFPVEPKTLNIKAGLKKDKSENKGHLKATAGDKTYVDIEGHIKKSDKPSGGFKVKLPTHIDTVGDFTFDGNNLVAKAELHLPKINKNAEAKADLKINKQKVAGNIDICWDTANPGKTLKIQTDTSKIDGDQKGFTSKNSLQYENKKTSLNAKYLVSFKNGKLADKGSSSGEFELELPNGLKVGGKSSGVWDVPAKQGERFYQLSMNEPNKTPKEVKLKIVGKNFDHEPLQFDSQVTLTYAEGDKDATLHYIVKKVPKDGEKWTVKGEFGSSGSLVKKPLTVSLISELSEKLLEGKLLDGNKGIPPMNYKFTLSQGSAITVESTGKLSGTTLAGELAAQMPEGKTVKSLKYVTSNVIDILPSTTHKKLKTSQHLQWDGDNFWKVEAEGNQEDDGIKYSLECESSTLQKRQISGTAHVNRHDGLKADLTSTLAWEGKTADFSAKFDSNKDNSIVGAHIASNFPDKKIDLLLKNKLTKEGKGIHTDVTLSHDNKKLSASSKIELDKDHPLLDVNIDHPEGGQSKLMLKADHKGHHHWSTALKAKWSNNGGTLSVENDANLGELDNLSIKSNIELPEHKKMSLDVNVKDGKKLSFTATKDEKPWISGNANYEKKIEGHKNIVTGKGNVEIDGKSYPLKYDGVYEKLEEGNKMSVEVEVGSRKVSVNAVKTPAEFSVERKYCKEDGKCSSAHFKNQIKKITKHNYEHNIDYQLDLSNLLGPKYHDLSFKSHFERNDLKMDHKVNAQWSDNGKISYDACVNEEKSGVTLVLPKRTVGGEIHYNIGKGEKVGNSKVGVDLWLNKEKNDILSLVASSDVSRNNDGATVLAQIHLKHPSLKKDLIVKGKATVNSQMNKIDAEGIVDVFKNANQKIVATYKGSRNIQDKNVHIHHAATLKSEGCKMDEAASWELKYNHQEKSIKTNALYTWAESNGAKNKLSYDVEGTPAKLIGNVHLPDGTTGKLDSKVQWENKVLNWPITANIGDLKYHNHLVVDLNENHLKNTAGCGGKTILLEAGVKIGKTGVLKLALDNKAATELNVALDESNFLKTKYNYDVDTLKAIWHTVANSLSTTIKTLDQKLIKASSKGAKICQAVLECLKDSAPDLTQAIDHVKGELKHIKEELQADQALNNLVHFIKVHLGKYGEQLETILEELAKFAKTINSLVKQSADKGYELYKTIAPKVQESVESISNIIVEVSERVLQLSIKIVDAVLDELKKHEKDIQEYVDAAIEFVHDFGKQFFQTALSIQEELKKFCDSTMESVKELPILTMIQEKLDEAQTWAVPEEIISVYAEIAEVVISIMPTPECEDFLSTASGYLVKLMNKEDFDKKEAAKQLSTKGEAALRSLAKKLAEFVPNQPTWKPNQWFQLPIVKVLRAPNGGVRLSAINWIVANGVPNAYQLLATYKPNLAKPLDNIPPFKGVGAIIGGNQILTFDGRHIDTSGSCSYVLAQDFVDKNFSVSAKFSGKWYLDSITIADPKNSITVVHKGQSSLNGAPTDFPLIAGDLGAFWTPFGYIIKSKAGVKITCDKLLANCFVTVSGFYFNKVRGLLGNLNYEPEDDWYTPSGEVASDVSAFTSAWKTNPGCASASGQSHSEPRQELCTDLFGKNPEILIGKPWANTEPWRAICDHGVNSAPADMKKKVACIIARDYVYYARKKGAFFLRLPLTCIECELENGESVENLSFEELKTDKAADIIFVVEATDDNKDTFNDLVNPLIAQLKTELAKKEISDVKVSILSFSPNHWHAVGHTSKGEGSYDGKHINMHWSPRAVDNNATIEDKVRHLLKKIGLETGTTPLSHAYEQMIKYNTFRPHALKAVIGVHGKPCHSPLNVVVPTKAILSILYSAYRGTTYHVISPVNNLQVEGVNSDEVVGFNLDHALTLDGKVHEANAEHDLDYCVESAEVSGSVFSVDNFKTAQSAGKGAQFVQTAAHSLATTIAKNAKDTVDCHCSLVDGLYTRVSCHKHDFLESEEDD